MMVANYYIQSRFLCNFLLFFASKIDNPDLQTYLIQIVFFFSGWIDQFRWGPRNDIEGECGQKQSSATSRQHHRPATSRQNLQANGVRSCLRCSKCHRNSKCGWWARSWQFRGCHRRIAEKFKKIEIESSCNGETVLFCCNNTATNLSTSMRK